MAIAADEAKDSQVVFRYAKDVTGDYHLWHKDKSIIYLSSATKRAVLGTPGTISLKFDELKPLPSYTTARLLESKIHQTGITLTLAACGKPAIDILLDDKKLLIHIDSSGRPKMPPGAKICGDPLPAHTFYSATLSCDAADIDTSNILASLNDVGQLSITIPILETPNRPPSLPNNPPGSVV